MFAKKEWDKIFSYFILRECPTHDLIFLCIHTLPEGSYPEIKSFVEYFTQYVTRTHCITSLFSPN